jgi:hypothetical protein
VTPPVKSRGKLYEALDHALDEELGRLIITLSDLPQKDLEALIEAAQLIDAEACDEDARREEASSAPR